MTSKLQIEALTLTILLTVSILLIGSTTIVKAQTETVVYVDPPEVKDIFSPNTFTISVKVANITDFYGLDLQFTWDPTVIKYVSHTKMIPVSTHPGGVLNSPTLPILDAVDETASLPGAEPGTRYWLAEASMLPAKGFNGSGTIFQMTFQVVGLGTSPLQILSCSLADSIGLVIPATIKQGSFVNFVPPPAPPADVFVTPPSIINSSLTSSHNFTISVNVTGVENLYSFNLDLAYNASILETSLVTVNSKFPSPTIAQSSGKVHVAASLTLPAPPIEGNLSLTLIKFHVLGEGGTALSLNNVTLLDNTGTPIDINEPEGGYFNNMQVFLVPATVTIQPQTLNLKSRGRWITALIELPSDYSVNDINVSSVMLNNTVPADLTVPPSIGDFDNDSDLDLMLSFNRTKVIGFILSQEPDIRNESIALTVSGKVINSVMFEGSGTVAVSPLVGDVDCNGIVDIVDIVAAGLSYNLVDGDKNWNPNANFASPYNKIDIFDLVTAASHYTETIP